MLLPQNKWSKYKCYISSFCSTDEKCYTLQCTGKSANRKKNKWNKIVKYKKEKSKRFMVLDVEAPRTLHASSLPREKQQALCLFWLSGCFNVENALEILLKEANESFSIPGNQDEAQWEWCILAKRPDPGTYWPKLNEQASS